MAMLLSWTLFNWWIYMSPCALIAVSISAQPQVFTAIYNWCQEKLTLPSGTCPFLRLQFCLEEMPLGHPGEVRHSQNPWTWLQVLWEWYLQALHGRWIAREPIDLGKFEASEQGLGLRQFYFLMLLSAAPGVLIIQMWRMLSSSESLSLSQWNEMTRCAAWFSECCWLDDSDWLDVGTCKTIFKMLYYYTLLHIDSLFPNIANFKRAVHGQSQQCWCSF